MIHIITIHHIHNFGSVFQATALEKFLESLGEETEIIDYRPGYYEKGNNGLKTFVGRILNLGSYLKRKKRFDTFIAKNEKLSPKQYTHFSELYKLDNEKDLFVAGGDQLWNDYHPCGKDFSYKLSFIKKGRKAAIGTSMGRNSFSNDCLNEIAKEIYDFQYIGLREKSTVEMLQPFTAINIQHVVDPVMLFPANWYIESFISKTRPIKEKYAVVYLTPKSSILDKAVKQLSEKGYKIVHICGFIKKCDCDYMMKDLGPEEILSFIFHADFVLSASFHATLFSLMFHKQFATLLPRTETNTRIEDVLAYANLENRIVKLDNDTERLFDSIDFSVSDKKFESLKEKTISDIKLLLNKN